MEVEGGDVGEGTGEEAIGGTVNCVGTVTPVWVLPVEEDGVGATINCGDTGWFCKKVPKRKRPALTLCD